MEKQASFHPELSTGVSTCGLFTPLSLLYSPKPRIHPPSRPPSRLSHRQRDKTVIQLLALSRPCDSFLTCSSSNISYARTYAASAAPNRGSICYIVSFFSFFLSTSNSVREIYSCSSSFTGGGLMKSHVEGGKSGPLSAPAVLQRPP